MRFILYGLLIIYQSVSLASLHQKIITLLSQQDPTFTASIIVQSVHTKKIMVNYRSNTLMIPASTQKLISATAALQQLGPLYTFLTQIKIKGKIKNNVLEGDIIYVYSGDPTLTHDDLFTLTTALRNTGIRRIKGHIVLQANHFSTTPYPPGWLWDDLSFAYAPPISSSNIDENKFSIQIEPSQKTGLPGRIQSNTPSALFHIENHTITVSSNHPHCTIRVYSGANNYYRIFGCLPKKSGVKYFTLAIKNTRSWSLYWIRQALHDLKITFIDTDHPSREQKTTLVGEHHSPPVKELIKKQLKDSDNLISESLLQAMIFQKKHHRDSWKKGIDILNSTLEKIHIRINKKQIHDGSGLSRYNLLSTNQLNQLLLTIYQQPSLEKYILPALSFAGIDGTLEHRLNERIFKNRVFAKTGSMHGISSLAGFIHTNNNGIVSLALIINSALLPRQSLLTLQKKICNAIIIAKKET